MCSEGMSGPRVGRTSSIFRRENISQMQGHYCCYLVWGPLNLLPWVCLLVPTVFNLVGHRILGAALECTGRGEGNMGRWFRWVFPNSKGRFGHCMASWWQLFIPRILSLYHQDFKGSRFIGSLTEPTMMPQLSMGHQTERNATVSQGQIQFVIPSR